MTLHCMIRGKVDDVVRVWRIHIYDPFVVPEIAAVLPDCK